MVPRSSEPKGAVTELSTEGGCHQERSPWLHIVIAPHSQGSFLALFSTSFIQAFSTVEINMLHTTSFMDVFWRVGVQYPV